MSWDVVLMKGTDASPEGDGPPLGTLDQVRAAISAALPQTDWSDPHWGILDGDGWSIEFNVGRDDVCGSVMLHVRGSGDPLPAIAGLCETAGWSAIDLSTGEPIDLRKPSRRGWSEFQAFRDGVVAALAPGDGLGLRRSGLRLDGRLLTHTEGARVSVHDLDAVSGLRVERGVNRASIGLAVISALAGIGAKLLLPWGWLGWLAGVLLWILAALFAISAPIRWLLFEENGRRVVYPLVDLPDEIDAFQANVDAVVGARDQR